MLSLENVSYTANKQPIIHQQHLLARRGELLALVGPNGAGKSTLLGLMSGRLTPQQGSITLDGTPLSQWPLHQLARRRAVLSQNIHLQFNFTAAEVVALGLSARPPNKQHCYLVNSALAAVGVSHLARRYYPTLSGGQQRQVQFARALAQIWKAPGANAWLLLDEPDAGLDIAHQEAIVQQAKRFAEQGYGVITVLHDVNLAARYANKVALITQGRIIKHGEPENVLAPELLSSVYGIALTSITMANKHFILPSGL